MRSSWQAVEIGIGLASAALLVGSLLAVPWLVRRLPPDYFARPPRRRSIASAVARNVLAIALIGLGVAMLVLPGQGIVTILLGVSILDLPIKHRILRWLLHRESIQRGMQRIRARGGKPPLWIPDEA